MDLMLYVWRGTQELPVPLTLMLGAAISAVSIAIAHLWAVRGARKAKGA